MKKLSQKMLTGLVLGSLMACGTAFAAEETAEFELDQIVVTATRTEKKDIDVPATTTVIDSKKIEAAGYKNVFDAIEHQVGMTSTGYGDAGQEFGFSAGRTVIRGYDRGTLVMVDGIPINLKNYNSLDGIPVDMVEKIEIVKGASGTLYGAEAMGGVINIITKNASNTKPSLKVKGTYGNYYRDYGATYSSDKVILSLQKEYSDAFRRSNDYPKASKYDWWIGKGRKDRVALSAKISDELSYNLMYQQGDISRGSNAYKLYDYKWDEKRMTTGLHYAGKTNGVKATLGYNYRSVDGWDRLAAKGKEHVDSSAHLKGYIADVQKTFEFGNNTLIAGYSFKREGYRNLVDKKNNFHRMNNALYLSYDHHFSDKFNMIFGLRGEAISDPVKDQKVLNPQVQAMYKFNDNTSWYVNVGKAFQMPTVDSHYKAGKTPSGNGLKPEKGWTYETGIKKVYDKSSLKFALYHMAFENKLGWKVDGAENIPINKGYFENTGAEIEFSQKLGKAWSYTLGAGYSNPVVKEPGKTWVQDAGRIDLGATIGYSLDKVRSTLTFKYLGDREYYSNYDVPYKSRLSWNTSYDFTKRDTVTLTLNNIFSRDNYANRYANYELPYNWKVMYTHTF